MRKRPPTVMMRIRTSDLLKMKKLARQSKKRLPDFQTHLLKHYRRKK